MAQINVTNLTFCYDGSFDNIFENVSFSIDTSWKLGLIGRNGKGKTTFLNLLRGRMEYQGTISGNTVFDYFPYVVAERDLVKSVSELMGEWKPSVEEWRVLCELAGLRLDAEVLYRPFGTLSQGERTKVMLAVLFGGEQDFLLIDEPTNHLDRQSRETIKEYLGSKEGFILVSHDRDLLDACVDHVLVLNRQTIEVQSGNFSSWWENKQRKDNFARMENEKHLKEIGKLKTAANRSARWAEKNENTKIGFDPMKEPDRMVGTRAYIGAKTKKMQSRVKSYEVRMEREIREKEGLLQDLETCVDLKIKPLVYHKERLVRAYEFGLKYRDAGQWLFEDMSFELSRGERVFLAGDNGCGKSSLIKAILQTAEEKPDERMEKKGVLETASGLVISYINQDTSFLKGTVKEFCRARKLEESLFLALLRKLDMNREQFGKNMEEYSEGQKKKVLIAASLMTPAHLYIWDEPLNYIDVFSRMQIEKLITTYEPTMLLVEHDVRFREEIATKVLEIYRQTV